MGISKGKIRKRWLWAGRRRWCAWGGILALLFQLTVPMGQGMSASAFAGGSDKDALPLVICTVMGGVAQVPEDGNSGSPLDQSAPCAFCLVCQFPSLCKKLLPVSAIAVPWPMVVALVYPENFDDVRISEWKSNHRLPRAPPSFT